MSEVRPFLRPSGLAMPLVIAAALFASAPAPARAQTNPVLAESLYEQGKQLFFKKEYAAACPKLAESDRLDPAGGTVLMLGECYEGEGKVASARIAYGEAIARAQRDRRADREKEAKKHLATIEAHVPKYVIEVPEDVRKIPGLVVKSGGVVIPGVSFGIELFADPGLLEITADAPGYETFHGQVTIKEGEAPRALVGPMVKSAPLAPVVEVAPRPPPTQRSVAALPIGIILGSVGFIAASFGGSFGGLAIKDAHTVNDRCGGRPTCGDKVAVDLAHTADREATAANVLIPVGAALFVAGVVVTVVTLRRDVKVGVRISPTGLAATGAF